MSGKNLWSPDTQVLKGVKKGDRSRVVFTYHGEGGIAKHKGKYKIYTGCFCNDYIWSPEKGELTLIIKKKTSKEKVKKGMVVTLEGGEEIVSVLTITYE